MPPGFRLPWRSVNKSRPGPETRSRYLQFLGAGSSDYPMAILNRAGVDLTTGEPVKAALTEFAPV